MNEISEAAWECADPGMQYDTTINKWHTAPNTGRINGSNPCSEYMHLDNSACNLASINLLKYLDEEGHFDVEAFRHTVEVVFTAQEILVGNADYPTERIGETSRQFRQLGLGYANLGALLMAEGLPYDSDGGRAWAGAITSLMTGHAYATSARTAGRMGPFAGYAENSDAMLNVLRMHRAAAAEIDEELVPEELLSAAQRSWDEAVEVGEIHGVRNSQASVLAPTGTIGLMMDCDTTGIEPDLALTKSKKLVGGGTMLIVNQTIPRALRKLGYTDEQGDAIVAYINEHKTIIGAPEFKVEHLPVFACSMGDNPIHYMGHVKMMAAAQPFLSGAISKTVNLPEEVSVDDVNDVYIESWKLGLKAVAIYRDNCKVGQPLSTQKKAGAGDEKADAVGAQVERIVETIIVQQPVRQKLPRTRTSKTFSFRVADCHGYATVGEFEDGRPGEVFLKVAKQGSTLAGIMDAFAILGQPRPAVRRAAAGVRRHVHEHALRARRDDRRPRHPVRHEPRRLHLPPDGGGVHDDRGAPGDRDHDDRRAAPAHAAGRGRVHHAGVAGLRPASAGRPGPVRRGQRAGTRGVNTGDDAGRSSCTAGSGTGALLRLRRHHAACGFVSRLPELRRHERLLVTPRPLPDAVDDARASARASSRRDGPWHRLAPTCDPRIHMSDDLGTPHLRLERRGSIVWCIIDRLEARNALDGGDVLRCASCRRPRQSRSRSARADHHRHRRRVLSRW